MSINPENVELLKKNLLPEPLPEKYTEAQQKFVDFVLRHTTMTDKVLIDCCDIREGNWEVSPETNLLFPISSMHAHSYLRITENDEGEFNPPYPTPHKTFRVTFSSDLLFGVAMGGLAYDQQEGWNFELPLDGGPKPVSEDQAKPTVEALLDLERNKALKPIDE